MAGVNQLITKGISLVTKYADDAARVASTSSDDVARYVKACGKPSILCTKPAHVANIEGLRYARGLTGDIVQFSRFTKPTETRIAQILKNNGLLSNTLLKKDGSRLLNGFEGNLITENNVIFIEELSKRFPLKEGAINTDLQELLVCLKDIKHTHIVDKQTFLDEFIVSASKVKSMKSVDGKLLFKDHMTGLYSRKAILEAKYNDTQRYQEIMDLYKLHQEGKAPRYLIETLFPKSHFHELPKSDIDKLLRGEHYFPRLSSLSETKISKLSVGEAFSVNNEMFVKTTNGYEKLRIDKSTYELLFPPIERYAMAQNGLDNCHLISTIDSITKDPNGRIQLYQMFEQTPNGIKCTIPSTECTTPFIFTLKDIEALQKAEHSIQGSLAHKMLEYTYARNKCTTITSDKVDDIIKIFSKGGDESYISSYYKDLLGVSSDRIQTVKKYNRYGEDLLRVNEDEIPCVKEIFNNIKNKTHQKIKCVDNGHIIDPDLGLRDRHYYNAIDTEKGFIINPWNTMETIPIDPFELTSVTSVSIT